MPGARTGRRESYRGEGRGARSPALLRGRLAQGGAQILDEGVGLLRRGGEGRGRESPPAARTSCADARALAARREARRSGPGRYALRPAPPAPRGRGSASSAPLSPSSPFPKRNYAPLPARGGGPGDSGPESTPFWGSPLAITPRPAGASSTLPRVPPILPAPYRRGSCFTSPGGRWAAAGSVRPPSLCETGNPEI